MSMESEQLAKAKMFFEMGIKYYPESPNVYDSMADYYESSGNYKEALQFVKKAFQLSDNDYYKERMAKLQKILNN